MNDSQSMMMGTSKSKVSFSISPPSAPRPVGGASAPFRLSPYTPTVPAVPSATAQSSSTREGTVPTRILLVSDTHAKRPFDARDGQHPFKVPVARADVLIHAGDLTTWGSLGEMRMSFAWLAAADAELKLVIAGNHDCGLDDPQAHLARMHRIGPRSRSGHSKLGVEDERRILRDAEEVRALWTSDEARSKGIMYLEEGAHYFELSNGAAFTIYASPYTPEYYDWAFMYPRSVDRYNPPPEGSDADAADLPFAPPNPVPSFPDVDLMVTHGPAQGILDRAGRSNDSAIHVGCEHLLRALGRARPRLHVFGHIHEDWGVAKVDWHHGRAEYLLPAEWNSYEADEEFQKAVKRGWIGWRERGVFRERAGQGVHESENAYPLGTEDHDGFVCGEPLRWGRDTLCVNASIMTGMFNPLNSPWLIDMLLPAREAATTVG